MMDLNRKKEICPHDKRECDIRMGNVYDHCRHGLPSVDGPSKSGRVCPIYEKVCIEPAMLGELDRQSFLWSSIKRKCPKCGHKW